MSNKHSHKHEHCKHTDVKYCAHCQCVYCADCEQEWVIPGTKWTWTNPYFVYYTNQEKLTAPYYTTTTPSWANTSTGVNLGTEVKTITGKHTHIS